MNILVTNDDGILSEGLWTLARELKKIAQVTVVAPDREQSAIGTAVTLRQTLRVKRVTVMPEVETYAVEGTPSDSVILALGKLLKGKVDLVVSGINQGMNLGEDVHISGTVGAALQGYLRGYTALAISAPYADGQKPEATARLASLIAGKIINTPDLGRLLLNINLPMAKINGIQITRLASESHINTVEEGNHGWQKYYWLVRQRTNNHTEAGTDVAAIEQGNISITPIYFNGKDKPPILVLNKLCIELSKELSALAAIET